MQSCYISIVLFNVYKEAAILTAKTVTVPSPHENVLTQIMLH